MVLKHKSALQKGPFFAAEKLFLKIFSKNSCQNVKRMVIYITVRHTDIGPVVQLVRMPPCHGGGRGFESHPGRQCGNSSVVEHLLAKEGVASSNLVFRSIGA